ncbi:hypothetical protein U9M48_025794 [Paspalum notatum var. saurae]|uniref:Uncharacterized protein n=1 Tax=Paspalum notatum var. saurae TaxID=547442 RepID=A0AAQ3WXP6_PASNO
MAAATARLPVPRPLRSAFRCAVCAACRASAAAAVPAGLSRLGRRSPLCRLSVLARLRRSRRPRCLCNERTACCASPSAGSPASLSGLPRLAYSVYVVSCSSSSASSSCVFPRVIHAAHGLAQRHQARPLPLSASDAIPNTHLIP